MSAYDDQKNALSRSLSTLAVFEMEECSQECGTAPCLHVGAPCHKTLATCKFRSAYTAGTREDKFCMNASPMPVPGVIIRPYISNISPLPQEIQLDKSLLVDFKVTLSFLDAPDSDFGVDPYRVSPTLRQAPSGSENIEVAGTYWSRWRARNRFYKNSRVRIMEGFVVNGFAEIDYKLKLRGLLTDMSVAPGGGVSAILKGVLQLTDVDYPLKTDGRLSAAGLSAGETGSFELEPWTGVDRLASPPVSKYLASGDLFVDGEAVGYDAMVFDVNTGITTFSSLTRGKYNNIGFDQAKAHTDDKNVQQAIYMQGTPPDLMHTLFNKAGILDSEIDVPMLEASRDLWFPGQTFAALLHKPTKIKTYLNELREESFTYIWQGADQTIKVKRLGPNPPGVAYRQITDASNIVYNSTAINDNQDGRITRSVVWYDLFAGKDPGKDNQRYSAGVADLDAEFENRDIKDRKPIYSRWIKSIFAGEIIARALASFYVRQFRDGAGTITFGLELKDSDVELGEIVELYSAARGSVSGHTEMVRCVITKLVDRGDGRFEVTGFDAKLLGRFIFIAPDGLPDYDTATEANKEFFYISGGTPSSPGNGDLPYMIS